MFAPIHSKVRVGDLLQGLIIQSANDAAIALAQGISGNETAFAIQMNARAKELGLTRSNFTNSTGLPDRGMQASVRDLAKLARHTIRTYPQFYGMYGEKEFTWNKIRQQNRNPLLAMNVNADGLKTGFTADGGYGLVGSAIQNNWRLIVVRQRTQKRQGARRRGEETALSGAIARSSQSCCLPKARRLATPRFMAARVAAFRWSVTDRSTLMVPRNVQRTGRRAHCLFRPLRAPVEQGAAVAKLRVSRGDIVALEVPLLRRGDAFRAAASPAGRSTLRPNWSSGCSAAAVPR